MSDSSNTSFPAMSVNLERRALADLHHADLWHEIRAAYTETHRAYHTLTHLHAMFQHFDTLQDRVTHRMAVVLAIWFHDFVYEVDAHYPDNEFRSADAMHALLSLHAPQLLEQEVAGINQVALADAMIRCTKGHALHNTDVLLDARAAQDARLFLDIDLSILSTAPAVIDAFESAIRYEFQQYPLPVYAQGRTAAMRAFLERPRIYLADDSPFNEVIARANLLAIVERWKRIS